LKVRDRRTLSTNPPGRIDLRIINREELTSKGDKEARIHLLKVLEVAIDSIDPYRCVSEALSLKGDRLWVFDAAYDLSNYDRILVVGAGKASKRMVEALNGVLGGRISAGIVNSLADGVIGRIELHKSTHPHPGPEGLDGAMAIMRLCESATEKDLIICLISGGGSAMMPCPVEGVTLDDKKRTAELLMLLGASIEELNVVRRHISRLKGGNLARIAYPATVLSLIVSDVVGDHLESISSGPTAPDPTTHSDALAVLKKYDLLDEAPQSVVDHLTHVKSENPKVGDSVFCKVRNVIVASNRTALLAAEKKARDMGNDALILTSALEGEAREVGRMICSIGNDMVEKGKPIPPPAVLVGGGETTVTVRGKGKGGRNSELVLGALQEMREGVTILSFGTDGIDGSSEAGGAIADMKSWSDDAPSFLNDNDSATYFEREGCLIFTGPTGTNVGDIVLVFASRKR